MKTYATVPTEEMNAMLERLRAQEPRIRRETLTLAAEALLSEAQIEAPVLTGALKASHFLYHASADHALIGCNTNYALAVHETHPTRRHWFINAVQTNFHRVFEGAMKIVLDRAARRAGR